jgi:transposase
LDTLPAAARGDLTDAQWAVIALLLPAPADRGRPPIRCRRRLIDGVRRRVRTGAPWRDVPARYGPWPTIYGLFRRWQRDGTWQTIHTALQAKRTEGLPGAIGKSGGARCCPRLHVSARRGSALSSCDPRRSSMPRRRSGADLGDTSDSDSNRSATAAEARTPAHRRPKAAQ